MILIIYKLGISLQNLAIYRSVHPPEYFLLLKIRIDIFELFHVCWNVILVFLQQIEIWKESEDGVLDISIKLYVKKDTHMVSSLIPSMFSGEKRLVSCAAVFTIREP